MDCFLFFFLRLPLRRLDFFLAEFFGLGGFKGLSGFRDVNNKDSLKGFSGKVGTLLFELGVVIDGCTGGGGGDGESRTIS